MSSSISVVDNDNVTAVLGVAKYAGPVRGVTFGFRLVIRKYVLESSGSNPCSAMWSTISPGSSFQMIHTMNCLAYADGVTRLCLCSTARDRRRGNRPGKNHCTRFGRLDGEGAPFICGSRNGRELRGPVHGAARVIRAVQPGISGKKLRAALLRPLSMHAWRPWATRAVRGVLADGGGGCKRPHAGDRPGKEVPHSSMPNLSRRRDLLHGEHMVHCRV